jgi:hypothetical protein
VFDKPRRSSKIGTPDEVAERMAAAMDEIGGDGFLISTPFQRVSRRYVNEIREGLVPAPPAPRPGTRGLYAANPARDAARVLGSKPNQPSATPKQPLAKVDHDGLFCPNPAISGGLLSNRDNCPSKQT